MKALFLFLVCFPSFAFAQNIQKKVLTSTEVKSVFPSQKHAGLNIKYPIREAYHYSSLGSECYLVLTEYTNPKSGKIETIEAIFLKQEENKLITTNSATDFIQETEVSEEYSIMWQLPYCLTEDIDGDGEAEVLLTYSSLGINALEDGQLKMLCYHKGKKYAVRHQNGTLDFKRKTTVDQAFYTLPDAIQTRIIKLITQLEAENKALFPAGWQEGVKKKQTLLKE